MALMALGLTMKAKWLDFTRSFFSVVRVFAELDVVVFAVRGHR
jgi:hypothetical protein